MVVANGKLVFPGADRVEIELDGGIMPKKASDYSAGFDLYCPKDTPITSDRQIVDLGIKMCMPPFFEAQVRPRSGYSAKGFELYYVTGDGTEKKILADIDVLLGTIDSDYKGHVGVILKVHHIPQPSDIKGLCYIKTGTRIAQLVFSFLPSVDIVKVSEIDKTNDRGGGFGHTNGML